MKWRGLRKEKARVGVCCEGNKFVGVILRRKPCPKFYEALGLLMLFIMEDAISCWEQDIHTMSCIHIFAKHFYH